MAVGTIICRLRKQTMVGIFTCEAECTHLRSACNETGWPQRLLFIIDENGQPATTVFSDGNDTFKLAANEFINLLNNLIYIIFHYVTDVVTWIEEQVQYRLSMQTVADLLIRSLKCAASSTLLFMPGWKSWGVLKEPIKDKCWCKWYKLIAVNCFATCDSY